MRYLLQHKNNRNCFFFTYQSVISIFFDFLLKLQILYQTKDFYSVQRSISSQLINKAVFRKNDYIWQKKTQYLHNNKKIKANFDFSNVFLVKIGLTLKTFAKTFIIFQIELQNKGFDLIKKPITKEFQNTFQNLLQILVYPLLLNFRFYYINYQQTKNLKSKYMKNLDSPSLSTQVDDDQISIKTGLMQEQMICKQKKRKKNKKWTYEQNILYVRFVKNHYAIFNSKSNPKKCKKFKRMAASILTKNIFQCRSHHQKMILKYQNLNSLISNLLIDLGVQLMKLSQNNSLKQQIEDIQYENMMEEMHNQKESSVSNCFEKKVQIKESNLSPDQIDVFNVLSF